jgi:predicted SprT family Zn-dependent metalloprotease
MDHWQAAILARQLIAEHRLAGWHFAFNRRKAALGLCRYDTKRIELSHHFVLRNDEPAVRDTILHEIAHALAGPEAGHGPRWQQMCRQIGASPQRVDYQAAMPRGKWQATCPGCGRTYNRHRRPMRNRIYTCRTCGPQTGQVQFRYGYAR